MDSEMFSRITYCPLLKIIEKLTLSTQGGSETAPLWETTLKFRTLMHNLHSYCSLCRYSAEMAGGNTGVIRRIVILAWRLARLMPPVQRMVRVCPPLHNWHCRFSG